MRFPYLWFALAEKNIPRYAVAAAIERSESRVSRGLRGIIEFSEKEKQKIAALVGFPASWLFSEVVPPADVPAGPEQAVRA